MKKILIFVGIIIVASFRLVAAPPDIDPAHIDAYITPYYDAKGPAIKVGRFSAGLASKDEKEFLATITKMKEQWQQLSFPELYVAAIRLYDLGYRKEAVYWFYSAQYRGRQFGMFLDPAKAGGIGDPGFELLHASEAFYELIGPYINGYAFGDTDGLIKVIEKVQKEGRQITDLQAIYPKVTFIEKSGWPELNTELADGMGKLTASLKEQKDDIKRQRVEQGIEAKYSKLTNKELPIH